MAGRATKISESPRRVGAAADTYNNLVLFRRFAPSSAALLLLLLPAPSLALDLRNAVVVAPASLTGPERKATAMLVDEIAARTRIRLKVTDRWSGSGPAVIACREAGLRDLGGDLAGRLIPATPGAEGYRVQTTGGVVLVTGNDARGTLYGVGALLRRLRMERDILKKAIGFFAKAPQ